MTWLQQNKVQYINDWPPNSPDLNPIQHVWHLLKLRLSLYERKARNIDELWERVDVEWNKLDKDVCRSYNDIKPDRIAAVTLYRHGLDVCTWLDEYQEKEDVHTWSQFKRAFTSHYGVGSAEEKATSTTELLRISMTAAETVDQYVERFNNLRRLAQIQDRCVLTRCFLIGLQADIYRKVVVSLANSTDAQKESVDYVVKLAKTLYHSLYKVRKVANAAHTSAGPSMVNDSSSSGRKRSSAFVSGSAVHR
ncbi:hypothetical protein G6F27_013300 [Rhizopus arrhizus]|nr:hypothetical protein G6F27_013300 [Rhizopus arrhizus]